MRRSVLAFASVLLMLGTAGAGLASADPVPPNIDSGSSSPGTTPPVIVPNQATVDHIVRISPTRSAVFINSPAMGRVVQVQILQPPSGGPRPTFYLLDGVDAGSDQNTWTKKTDVESFFAGKNVNVVLPVGGMGSFYTDWQRPDAALGVNKWETFLTKELPPLVDRQLGGNGVNAIGGLSMGGQSALILTTRHPELYRGVAVYSACPDTSTPNSKTLVRATVASRGGDATNMWGPDTDPAWAAHDPMTNADKLRGKTVYVAVGNGLPGLHELKLSEDLPSIIAEGGPLETVTLMCTRSFDTRLRQLAIPARFDYRPTGTHSWPYWQDDLHASWPTVARSLGL